MVAGTLYCIFKSATLTRSEDWEQKSSTQFAVQTLDQVYLCPLIENDGQNFTFDNFQIILPVKNQDDKFLLKAEDTKKFDKNKVVGFADIDSQELTSSCKPQEKVFSLRNDDDEITGEVTLLFQWRAVSAGKLILFPLSGNFNEEITFFKKNFIAQCEITVQEQVFRTQSDKENVLQPQWSEERFEVDITQEIEDSCVNLRVYHEDESEAEKYIGYAQICLGQIQDQFQSQITVKIYRGEYIARKLQKYLVNQLEKQLPVDLQSSHIIGEITLKYEFIPQNPCKLYSNDAEGLTNGQFIQSLVGGYKAMQNSEGNFVVLEGDEVIWSTDMEIREGEFKTVLQDNGNIVIYKENQVIWCSNSTKKDGSEPYYIRIQNTGNLEMFDDNDCLLWSNYTDY